MLIVWSAVFLALTYLPYLAPARAANLGGLMVYWTIWCWSLIVLCDAIRLRMEAASLLDAITRSRKLFLRFAATGAVCGLLLDGTAQWLCKLWIYPYWNTALYASTFVVGFCAYWLLLAETYFLARAALRRLCPRKDAAQTGSRGRFWITTGVALACAGIGLGIWDYVRAGGFRFAISTPSPIHASFSRFLLAFLGFWVCLEGLLARRGRSTLIAALRQHDWRPAGAVLLAGWGFGLLMETANAAQHFWRYTNWPSESTTLCGVPVVVLAAWPMQYLVFVAAFGVFSGEAVWN